MAAPRRRPRPPVGLPSALQRVVPPVVDAAAALDRGLAGLAGLARGAPLASVLLSLAAGVLLARFLRDARRG